MAYPTGVAFKSTSPTMGTQPIHEASETKYHELGTLIRATDVTYGEGEFVYLLGVASTAQGDLVTYNSKTGATIRAVAAGTGSQGPVAVAMSACDASTKYGWYQVSGSTPVNAATAAADTDVYLTATAGQVDDLVNVADRVTGASFKAATSAGFATVQFSRASVGKESTDALFATAQADIATAQATADAAATKASILKITLTPSAELADVITITGVVEDLAGLDTASAKQVLVRTLAVTPDKGDIAVTAGTAKKIVNPATGENVAWIETTAAGAFTFTVTNDQVEDTLVHVSTTTGVSTTLKLTFAA